MGGGKIEQRRKPHLSRVLALPQHIAYVEINSMLFICIAAFIGLMLGIVGIIGNSFHNMVVGIVIGYVWAFVATAADPDVSNTVKAKRLVGTNFISREKTWKI